MAMELFNDINVIIQRPASKFRVLSINVNSPAIARVDKALGVVRNVFPSQRIH
jgi:hypothetical protein